MRKGGILNPALLRLLAETGHTDLITICDRGFPVPIGPERIDLALVDGIPTVMDVLRAVLAEFKVDRVIATEEMEAVSPERLAQIRALGVNVELIAHHHLKAVTRTARGTIRTADPVPYANIIIVSG